MNSKSITRSNELHDIGKKLQEQLDKIPCGTTQEIVQNQLLQKSRIIQYFKADENDWNNWKWHYKHRIQTLEVLKQFLLFSEQELNEIECVSKQFRFSISPYYLSLIQRENPLQNIGCMSIPVLSELNSGGIMDPSAEEDSNPIGGIVRRYPNRAIINVTNCCASFCRHCQRKRNIGSKDSVISSKDLEESLMYIRNNTEINDVLITGGDALTLDDNILDNLLSIIRSISHVDIIRLGSRMPVNLPQRITPKLVSILKKHAPIYLNTQFNHPLEITPESIDACNLLADSGIMLGNQMVLLKGVNNDKYVVQLLNRQLIKLRVRPYYIFHAKDVKGTMHFQTSLKEGIEILSHLCGNTSGLSIPRYIVSAPNGLGKISISQDTLSKENHGIFELVTWEGKRVTIPNESYTRFLIKDNSLLLDDK